MHFMQWWIVNNCQYFFHEPIINLQQQLPLEKSLLEEVAASLEPNLTLELNMALDTDLSGTQ